MNTLDPHLSVLSILVDRSDRLGGTFFHAARSFTSDVIAAVGRTRRMGGHVSNPLIQVAVCDGSAQSLVAPSLRDVARLGLHGKDSSGVFADLDEAMQVARSSVGSADFATGERHVIVALASAASALIINRTSPSASETLVLIACGQYSDSADPERRHAAAFPARELLLHATTPQALASLGSRLAAGLERADRTGATLVGLLGYAARSQQKWRRQYAKAIEGSSSLERLRLLALARAERWRSDISDPDAELKGVLASIIQELRVDTALYNCDWQYLSTITPPWPGRLEGELDRTVEMARSIVARASRVKAALIDDDIDGLKDAWQAGDLEQMDVLGPFVCTTVQSIVSGSTGSSPPEQSSNTRIGTGVAGEEASDEGPAGCPSRPFASAEGGPVDQRRAGQGEAAGQYQDGCEELMALSADEAHRALVERIRDALRMGRGTRLADLYRRPGAGSSEMLTSQEHLLIREMTGLRSSL